MAIKEGEQLLDDEEITLSSSELDDVLSSAEFDEPDAGGEEGSLEQYGVWVKVKPEDLQPGKEGREDFGLADFDSEEDVALTPEEEELLGELEDETVGGGAFEGLDADLEELGRGVESEPSGFDSGLEAQEEELSVDDLDVDLESLDLERPLDQSGGDLETLTDLDETSSGIEPLEDLSLDHEAAEIEFPLSERAAVEEHITALPGHGEPAASSSSNILEKIETDLQQIKSEIQTLKRELSALGRGGPASQPDIALAPGAPPGFFNQEEDETIALTGDELDNILNTADITEETAEPMLEDLEDLEEELPEIGDQPVDLDLAEDAFAEEPAVQAGGAASAPEEAEDILDLGSLTLEESDASEELEDIEIDVGGVAEEGLGLPEEEPGAEAGLESLELAEDMQDLELEPAVPSSGAEEELILEELGEIAEPEEELLLEETETAAPEADEMTLGEEGEAGETGLEELSLDDLGLEDVESVEEPPELAADLEEFAAEAPLETAVPETRATGTGVEEFTLDEQELEVGEFEELGAVEGEEELLSLDAVEETAEFGEPEPALGEPEAELGEAEEGLEALEPVGEEELELTGEGSGTSADLLGEEPLEELGAEVELGSPVGPATAVAGGTAGALSGDLKKDVRSVLEYLDQLLEALPDEKIREFAQSEYFGIYKRLFDELGLRA